MLHKNQQRSSKLCYSFYTYHYLNTIGILFFSKVKLRHPRPSVSAVVPSLLHYRDIFAIVCKSNQMKYLKKSTFLHSINVNKTVLEYTVYSIKNMKNLFGRGLEFTMKNWLKSYRIKNKCNI